MSDTHRDPDLRDQLSLFSGEHASPEQSIATSKRAKRSKPTDRLFFALQPDAQASKKSRDTARRLSVDHRLSGSPFAAWRLHVSLEHLGKYVGVPKNVLQRAQDIAATIRMQEFPVRFDRVTTLGFPGKPSRPIVLVATQEMPELTSLMRVLFTHIHNFLPISDFTPHMTLLYDERVIDDVAVEPVTWIAREFVLIHNVLGTGRPYEILGRWPLLRRA